MSHEYEIILETDVPFNLFTYHGLWQPYRFKINMTIGDVVSLIHPLCRKSILASDSFYSFLLFYLSA